MTNYNHPAPGYQLPVYSSQQGPNQYTSQHGSEAALQGQQGGWNRGYDPIVPNGAIKGSPWKPGVFTRFPWKGTAAIALSIACAFPFSPAPDSGWGISYGWVVC